MQRAKITIHRLYPILFPLKKGNLQRAKSMILSINPSISLLLEKQTDQCFLFQPWDDETDMDAMLKACKSVEMDGLVWGANKLVPVGYGINKLQLMCVVEDEKVSIDELQEKICEFEDFVQSVDVAAMNKI